MVHKFNEKYFHSSDKDFLLFLVRSAVFAEIKTYDHIVLCYYLAYGVRQLSKQISGLRITLIKGACDLGIVWRDHRNRLKGIVG